MASTCTTQSHILMLGVTLQRTKLNIHPCPAAQEMLLVALCYENQEKLWSDIWLRHRLYLK